MKIPGKLVVGLGLLVFSSMFIPVTVRGQSTWLDPTVESSIALEILKPDYWTISWYESVEPKAYSSVWFLSFRARISRSVFWLMELPTSHYAATQGMCGFWGCSEYDIKGRSLIGNPYFGVEATSSVSPFYGQFGFRLPLTADDEERAAAQGVIADPSRLGAFLHDVITIRVRAGVRTREESGLAYHIFLGPFVLEPVGDLSDADSEVYIDYGSQLWFVTEKARLGAGLVGQLLATSEGDGLGESSLHQFGIAANFLSGRFRPGGHLRVPLDDNMPGLQYVWGLTLQVGLGSQR